MNIRRLFALVFCVVMLFAFASCGSCKAHVDRNDDYKCDNCGADYDDGDEAPEAVSVTVKFTVRLDTGNALPGVTFTLTRSDEKVYELTSGEDGSVTASIEVGAYYLDCFNLPANCILETPGVKITEKTTSAEFIVTDNIPDGSMKKPFFISEKENQVTLAPGQEIFYICHASSANRVKVYNENISIAYEGEIYEANDGCAEVLLSVISGGQTVFSLKNNSDGEISTTLYFESAAVLGSMENPIPLSENSLSVTVNSEKEIHYSWTAYKSGVLLLQSPTERNNISLINGDDASHARESGAAYMYVSAGDTVIISVSVTPATDEDPTYDVALSLSLIIHEGTADDPVPVLKNEIYIALDPKTEIVFTGEKGKTLHISDESQVSVLHDSLTYTNSDHDIELTLLGSLFVLQNPGNSANGITMIFE